MHSFSALEINFESQAIQPFLLRVFGLTIIYYLILLRRKIYHICIVHLGLFDSAMGFFLHASVNTSQRVYISAIVETYLLCGVSIPFIFRRFPFATPFMCSRFLFLFGTPLMCSRTPFFLITVVLILFLCRINKTCSSLNTRQQSG